MLSGHWTGLGVTLGTGAAVLDIGCGGGAVGRCLAAAAPGLSIVGIDLAQVPSSDHPNVQALSGVAAESLPFPNSSFDLAVSQFGFEYCNVDFAADELARVLKPGARFSFVVHHSRSPIIEAERVHNRALEGIADQSTRSAFLSGNALALRRRLRLLEWQFPSDTTIAVAGAGLIHNHGKGDRERVTVWNAVMEAVRPDWRLARALEASCVGPELLEDWLRPLKRGFDLQPPAVLSASDRPLAWKIEGSRKGCDSALGAMLSCANRRRG